ncbi:hypothetical protein [Halomarina oriensis]|uniref:Uncharacterized protein n=1 Tax=Halomarina oriensis TaxID=671145 RepID=A0A6B0GPC4_9EURY|nr:hypothetical protein [Halomarina oriensis]MWG35389.1 hypothetical protein [Halomarina oriensis]
MAAHNYLLKCYEAVVIDGEDIDPDNPWKHRRSCSAYQRKKLFGVF